MTGVLFDIQGVQSPTHGERGIARYLAGLALELDRRHPELITSFLLNPELPIPALASSLQTAGRLGYPESTSVERSTAFHIGSLIEPEVDLERLWPGKFRHLPLVVTLYDLIPDVFADHYLAQAGVRRWYRTRVQLLQRAERVLAISDATARDAVGRLALRRDRVVTVGAGVSEHFRPASRPSEAIAALTSRLPSVRAGFILYTGGIEFRKNIDRLLIGYSKLPKDLRDEHQLVVVCRVTSVARAAIDAQLAALGLSQHVVFTGAVAEEDLILLYQAAELFVFPSLYEGFGLPVAEAMACGAPVMAARTSALVELVDDEDALFDPTRPQAIEAAIRNGLEDPNLRARLRSRSLDKTWRWPAVADRTAEVYEDVARLRPRRRRRRRPRIAFVSPLPPQVSGVADYSYRLLDHLSELVDVDVFTDLSHGAASAPRELAVQSITSFRRVEEARGGYDEVIACIGNSSHHAETLALVRRRPSVVLAHDVRLTGLYAWMARHRSDLERRSFRELLDELHPTRLPPDVGERGWLDCTEYERHGILMAREVIARSTRFLVHSAFAANLARVDADSTDQRKIGVVPFGYPDIAEVRTVPSEPVLVATFGLVAAVKQTDRIIEAFALAAARRPDVILVIVGPPTSDDEQRRICERAQRLGIENRVRITGEVSATEFRTWLGRTTVAVQLRASSNGECSASLADCLAAGIPTIATALGATLEVPEDAYVGVERDVSAAELAEVIEKLLNDPERRQSLTSNGHMHASANSFEFAAKTLVELLFGVNARASRAA